MSDLQRIYAGGLPGGQTSN